MKLSDMAAHSHHCKDCGLNFDSIKSLDVHLHYHKENLLIKWGQHDEANNNNASSNSKRVTTAAADSSEGAGHTSSSPQPGYNHPPTPGSYSNVPSPYQEAYPQNGGTAHHYHQQQFTGFMAEPVNHGSFGTTQPSNRETFILGAAHDFPSSSNVDNLRPPTPTSVSSPSPSYRYHPYQYVPERNNGVTSTSTSYQPPPTPQQCEKCGFVCSTSAALMEHVNVAHPPAQSPSPYAMFATVKTEDKTASEILDLDSHKVHQVFQPQPPPQPEERDTNPHSVSAMLWGSHQQQQAMTYQRGGGFPMQHNVPNVTSSLPPPSPKQAKNGSASGGQSWKSNEARRPKTYNCSACNKWFTSSGHLKRHYNTTLHKNAVKQSGIPDPATQPISNHHHPGRTPNEMGNSPRLQSPAPLSSQLLEDSSRSDDNSSNGTVTMLQQQATSPPNAMAGPPISMEAQMGGLQFYSTSSENSLVHNPSNSVHTSPHQDSVLHHQMQTQQQLSIHHHHPYMLGQVASPPSHPLIHHPIPQHQIRHPTPQSLQMTEMYSPNGQPPHISTIQQQQPMLPTSISNHLIPTTGNCGSSGDNVSRLQDDQFLYSMTSLQEQETQPLPSFAQIGHNLFGSNSSFGHLASSSQNYEMATTTGPVTTVIDNVGGLINSENEQQPQQLLVTLKQSDNYNNNNMYWVNSFDVHNSLLNESCNTPSGESDISPAATPKQETESELVSVKVEEESVTSSPSDKMPLKVDNVNINNNVPSKTKIKEESKNVSATPVEALHRCIECDKVFNKACYLTQHNKSFHSGHKPYKCERCGKRFTEDKVYTKHISKHAGEKPHKCEICPKQFNHKTDLRRHMCLHTGEKPYACHICGKGFIRKDHMLKHCETHRKKTAHHHLHNSIPVVAL